MNKEDKQLLLTDLCGRLLHGVKCAGWMNIPNDEDIDKVYPYIDGEYIDGITENRIRIQGTWIKSEFVRPYLRPMNTMTEEEMGNLEKYLGKKYDFRFTESQSFIYIDWLNAHHFDYRGLIEKGLALPAPKGMYNFK